VAPAFHTKMYNKPLFFSPIFLISRTPSFTTAHSEAANIYIEMTKYEGWSSRDQVSILEVNQLMLKVENHISQTACAFAFSADPRDLFIVFVIDDRTLWVRSSNGVV
jgi:hypothetical protein